MRTKALLTALIFIVAIYSANAQVIKNRFLLGGSINYYHTTNSSLNSFYSNIQIGKVIANNAVVGFIGIYASNNANYPLSSPYNSRYYSAGIFYRKYMPLAKKFYFFGELDASCSFGRNLQEAFGSTYYHAKSSGANVSFVPGISYNVWKRLQMELSIPSLATLSYSHASTIDETLPPGTPHQKTTTYVAGVNLNSNTLSNFAIGFKFLLGK